ncbi:hypothetical protein SB775_34370, partial [Peribacillus sp. SIMBA_075]|uniref:hypothetical protein n=1 Tax=Peribacillus sp. SIMBA_075 TaxID=3085813 RepID=UPI003978ED37
MIGERQKVWQEEAAWLAQAKQSCTAAAQKLDQMTAEQLRALAAQLLSKVDTMGRKIHRDETIIEQ